MNRSDFTLLIADDNPAIRSLYLKFFVKEGFKVLLSENGAQVLAELKDEKVDLLLLDLQMPGMNTLELFSVLKEEYPDIPVIVVSGFYRNLTEDFMGRGFNLTAFVQKPVALSILKEKIQEVLKMNIKISVKRN